MKIYIKTPTLPQGGSVFFLQKRSFESNLVSILAGIMIAAILVAGCIAVGAWILVFMYPTTSLITTSIVVSAIVLVRRYVEYILSKHYFDEGGDDASQNVRI